MKICTKCKINKEESKFTIRSQAVDGLQSRCRDCNLTYRKHYVNMRSNTNKKCYVCKIIKSAKFYHSCRDSKDGLSGRCKKCSHNRDKLQRKNNHLERRYGISLEIYDKMYNKQEGKCAICNIKYPLRGKTFNVLYVDHDHITNKVRGLLCGHCNSSLGYLKDNIETLKSAISYLNKHKIKQAYNTNSII